MLQFTLGLLVGLLILVYIVIGIIIAFGVDYHKPMSEKSSFVRDIFIWPFL